MTPFQFPKATDAAWVKPLLNAEGLALCNYSFPVLFCWQHAYDFRYAREGDRLLTRLTSSLGHSYLWPVGEGDPKPALDAITQDAREEGQPLRLIALTQYHKNWLEANYPDRFAFEEARDGFDYLYDIDRLADLPGKKLHAKRNHIHRLDEAYPGWDWTPMTQADIAPCLAMDAAWHQEALTREAAEGGLSTLDDEHRALVLALENREALGPRRHRPALAGGDPGLHPGRSAHGERLRRALRAGQRGHSRGLPGGEPAPLPGTSGRSTPRSATWTGRMIWACPACARPRNPIIPITWKLILAQWRSAAT